MHLLRVQVDLILELLSGFLVLSNRITQLFFNSDHSILNDVDDVLLIQSFLLLCFLRWPQIQL